MLTLVGLQENGWLTPKTERFMWRQLSAAYGAKYELVTTFDQVTIDCKGTRIFLDPFAGESLEDYSHPTDAVYIFGRAGDNNRRWIASDDKQVRIITPTSVDMFAICAAAIVLEDRFRKHGNR